MAHVESLLSQINKHPVWTFTGLHSVHLDEDQLDLGENYFLKKPDPFLLSARWDWALNGRAFQESERLSCFFVLKESLSHCPNSEAIERLQNGLMAIQILKPVKTFGFIFQGLEINASLLNLQRIVERPPMEPGEWAANRVLNRPLLDQVPDKIVKVKAAMSGGAVEKKNPIILLQLALEQPHPLIAGLLCVMGLEAVFDSEGRNDFKNKLCDCLGAATLVFPDWNAPDSAAPKYTVAELAIPLYMLRNKLAHGADLRTASLDKTTPVDLIKQVELAPNMELRANAFLLSEAAHYLLCQVLQKIL
jgi:hypothetical protein